MLYVCLTQLNKIPDDCIQFIKWLISFYNKIVNKVKSYEKKKKIIQSNYEKSYVLLKFISKSKHINVRQFYIIRLP